MWKVERPILIQAFSLKKQTRWWRNPETKPFVWVLGTDIRLLLKQMLVRYIVNSWNGLNWRSIDWINVSPVTVLLSPTLSYCSNSNSTTGRDVTWYSGRAVFESVLSWGLFWDFCDFSLLGYLPNNVASSVSFPVHRSRWISLVGWKMILKEPKKFQIYR